MLNPFPTSGSREVARARWGNIPEDFHLAADALLRQPTVLASLVVLGALGLAVGPAVARRHGRSALLGVAAAWSLALVLSLTLVPPHGLAGYLQPWRANRVTAALTLDPGRTLTAWTHGFDGPPNVALFALPAFSWGALTRRPLRVVLWLVDLSVGIETVQAWSGTRAGQVGDVVSNTVGAVGGAALAGAVLLAGALWRAGWAGRSSTRVHDRRWTSPDSSLERPGP